MSNTCLIKWFEQLLFGRSCQKILPPPTSLLPLVARLEVDGIDWKDMMNHGGFSMFRYQVQGDLEVLMDYFEKNTNPSFHTRSIRNFFNQLLVVLARRQEPIVIPKDDKEVLQSILSNDEGPFQYTSAQFWGDLTRQWLVHRRPLPKELVPLPSSQEDLAILYDVECQTRGEKLNPLSSHLVPHSEYVNSVHWETESLLETFIHTHPNHVLSQSVQRLVLKAFKQLLNGVYPTCLNEKDTTLSTFLLNISVLDNSLEDVSLIQTPPKVIDVFQRLLATAKLDGLWETVSHEEDNPPLETDMMRLAEQLHLAQRQNVILLRHIGGD